MMAGLATDSKKAVLQAATLEEILKFPSHIDGQGRPLQSHQPTESRVIPLHHLIQERQFVPVRFVNSYMRRKLRWCMGHEGILSISFIGKSLQGSSGVGFCQHIVINTEN